jgi:hypothetical protein
MNMSENQEQGYMWNANDYSNIITIGASALASVLLVIFKSRCKTINLCCGLINCIRDPKDDTDTEEQEENKKENSNIKPLELKELKIENT